MDLEFHDLAYLIPPLKADEYEGLKASITELGQLEPIVLYEGRVLDGRHRYTICRELGLVPLTKEWDKDIDPEDWVIATHLDRRQLDAHQKAAAAARDYDRKAAWEAYQSGANLGGGIDQAPGIKKVSTRWHVDPKNMVRAAAIKEFDAGLFEQVFRGEIRLDKAEESIPAPKRGGGTSLIKSEAERLAAWRSVFNQHRKKARKAIDNIGDYLEHLDAMGVKDEAVTELVEMRDAINTYLKEIA